MFECQHRSIISNKHLVDPAMNENYYCKCNLPILQNLMTRLRFNADIIFKTIIKTYQITKTLLSANCHSEQMFQEDNTNYLMQFDNIKLQEWRCYLYDENCSQKTVGLLA
ncbi:hypothetical protein RND81_07G020100 [Saponaria officinalis]|uniref:Uncharacterized protein n=1 Tax=Saponaria officinalis TaxID=3572 RepID=A0AAW1JJZ0_SAPOF